MAWFDGTGSFGLGFGGFDVSDALGLTADFGTIDSGDNAFGSGYNDFNSGQQDYIKSFGNDFGKAGQEGAFSSDKFDTLGQNNTGGGLGGLFGMNTNTGKSSIQGTGSKQGMDWLSAGGAIYTALDNERQRGREALKYNNIIRDKEVQEAGQNQLKNTFYGVENEDSKETIAQKTNNNPFENREKLARI